MACSDPMTIRPYEAVSHLAERLQADIATATITGPEVIGDKLVYKLSRAIGSKGQPLKCGTAI